MNPNRSTFNPAAEEQASLWAARLDGSALSAADRGALDTWLAADPSHRELLASFCQLSADLEQKLPALAVSGLDLPDSAPRRFRRATWVASLSLAAAAAVAVAVWMNLPRHESARFATPVAQRQSLTLADGTQVDLNAQSSLQVSIDGETRRVLLASGEAFFAVRKDPTRPFIVESPAGSVRVTGTQFDVRIDGNTGYEVTVLEGSVQARPLAVGNASASPQALGVGDQLSAGPAGVEVRRLSTSALGDALAWRKGQVVFNRTPLREALARFARYHGRGISVTPDIADKTVGGLYSLDDLDGFLNGIEDGMQVRVTRDLNGTVQVSARPSR